MAMPLIKQILNRIVGLEKSNTYSTEEQVIGKWIDGKPLYRKVVDFGFLPNATFKSVDNNINNIENYVNIKGIATSSKDILALPYVHPAGIQYSISLDTNLTYINITTGSDRSNYNAKIILEYTKTTD